ncbi:MULTISPECIES: hypothetical protein [Rhodophyticola]|jgi:hypothetical protein|uniref:hypothetical protein n=1 Tax=Rhodophyticola TaxID=2680018 RepID=UPI0035CF7609
MTDTTATGADEQQLQTHRRETESRLLRLVQLQVLASIAIGGFVIGAVVYLGADGTGEDRTETLSTLRDWGGMVMGFFFGSMFTQMSTIVEAFRSDKS